MIFHGYVKYPDGKYWEPYRVWTIIWFPGVVPKSANPLRSFKDVTPFGTGKIVLSIGMGIVALLSIHLGYWNLDDNIIVQNVALMVIILSLGAQGLKVWKIMHPFVSNKWRAEVFPRPRWNSLNFSGQLLVETAWNNYGSYGTWELLWELISHFSDVSHFGMTTAEDHRLARHFLRFGTGKWARSGDWFVAAQHGWHHSLQLHAPWSFRILCGLDVQWKLEKIINWI